MTAKVTFAYLNPSGPEYPQEYLDAVESFIRLRFRLDELGEIVHPDFVELSPDGKVTLGASKTHNGLEALQGYRRPFGKLDHIGTTVYLVSPEQTMLVPDGSGEQYDIDVIFVEEFWQPVDGPLPPGSPKFPKDTPPARICIRMREAYRLRRVNDKLMVVGRTYIPIGEATLLEPAGQHMLVVRQLLRYWRYLRRGGRPQELRPYRELTRPLLDIVREEEPELLGLVT